MKTCCLLCLHVILLTDLVVMTYTDLALGNTIIPTRPNGTEYHLGLAHLMSKDVFFSGVNLEIFASRGKG